MTQEQRAEFVKALRQYAAIIEQHEDVPTPWGVYVYVYGCKKEQLVAAAKAFPRTEKKYQGDGYFNLSAELTPQDNYPNMKVVFEAKRTEVCTMRVTGTKKVATKRPTGYIDVVEEQEVVEWDCSEPLLAPPKQEAN